MRVRRPRLICRRGKAEPQLIHCNAIRTSCRRRRNASWFTSNEQAVNLITTFNNFIIEHTLLEYHSPIYTLNGQLRDHLNVPIILR